MARVPSSEIAPVVPLWVRMEVVLRAFWIQASLNYESMQGLGRLVCLLPVIRWLSLPGKEFASFVRRHSGLFNSNPFIATLGLGALARLEFDRNANPESVPDGMIERFSERVSTPLGSVGDELFWVTLRPHAVLLGALGALLTGVWGACLLLVVFGVWQGYYRWNCFTWGWASGARIAAVLQSEHFRRPAIYAGWIASGCAGAAFVLLLVKSPAGALTSKAQVAAFAGAFAGACAALSHRKPATWALLVAIGWTMMVSFGAKMLCG